MNEAGAQASNEDRRTLKPLAMIYAQRHLDGTTDPPEKESEKGNAPVFTEGQLTGDKSLHRGYRNEISGYLIMPVRFLGDFEKNQTKFVFHLSVPIACMLTPTAFRTLQLLHKGHNRYQTRDDDYPVLIYSMGGYNPDHVSDNLLKSDYLICVRLIFLFVSHQLHAFRCPGPVLPGPY